MTATNGPDALAICEQGAVRHRAARRHDAGHGRLRGLPAAEEPDRDRASAGRAWSPRSTSPPTACAGSKPAPTISSPSRSTKSQLIARVRSLARLKVVIDELRNRANTTVALGMIAPFATPERRRRPARPHPDRRRPRQLRRAPRRRRWRRITPSTSSRTRRRRCSRRPRTISTSSSSASASRATTRLRLCSQIRSLERTRNLPILVIADLEDRAARAARPRTRRQRLADAPGRPQRTARARAHAVAPEALCRQPAREGAAVDRTGAVRSADRPQQSPLPGKPSGDDARQRARAPRAADADDPRHRSFQARQRHLRPRLPATRC